MSLAGRSQRGRIPWLVPIVLGLGGSACGEINGFCLTAGAPTGVTLVATFTPTPTGNRLTCSFGAPDSSRAPATGRSGNSP